MSTLRLNRYKVLGAALTLQEFTAPEIARYSSVNNTYVQKILSDARDGNFFERVGRSTPSGKGSPTIRWRVAGAKVEQLRTLLTSLYDELKTLPTTFQVTREPQGDPSTNPSAELLAAENALLDEYVTEGDPNEKSAILNRAIGDLQKHKELYPFPSPSIDARTRVVDSLIELCQAEQDSSSRFAFVRRFGVLHAVYEAIINARKELDAEYICEVMDRLDRSSLFPSEAVENAAINIDFPTTWISRNALAVRSPNPFVKSPDWPIDLVLMQESDPETAKIDNMLTSAIRHGVFPYQVRRTRACDILKDQTPNTRFACILVCNSGSSKATAKQIASDVSRHWGLLVVLDAQSTPELMRIVLRFGAQYVPNATELDEPALNGLTMGAFYHQNFSTWQSGQWDNSDIFKTLRQP